MSEKSLKSDSKKSLKNYVEIEKQKKVLQAIDSQGFCDGRAGELVIFLLLQTSLRRAVPFASQRLNRRCSSVLPAIRFELSYRVRFFRP